MTRLKLAFLGALALGGCAGTAPDPLAQPDSARAGYRTFDFAPGVGELHDAQREAMEGAEGAGDEPLSSAALEREAARQLEARGFERSGEPDLWVEYGVDQQGTLTVALVDPRRGALVWEGTRADSKREPDDAKTAMAELFAALPLSPGVPSADAPADAGPREPDLQRIVQLALEGDPNAQYLLGVLLLEGRWLPADPTRAAGSLAAAAEQGHAHAQADLGLLYLNGVGVEADPEQARRWLELAAEQEILQAELALASMYLRGAGVPQDDAEALRLYSRAAERGAPRAQSRLGMMFQFGRGVAADPVVAWAWFELAAQQGAAGAAERRDSLALGMSVEQLEQAEARALAWLAQRGS